MIPFPYQIGQAGIGGGRRGQQGVALLLHMDGMQGSSTFVDSSTPANVFTALGGNGAVISTAQSVFGGSSGLFNGTTAEISTPSTADLDYRNMDFCIEARVQPLGATNVVRAIFGNGDSALSNASLGIQFDRSAANRFRFVTYNAAGTILVNISGTTATVAGTWYHVAVTKQGSVYRLFVNGVQEATVTQATEPNYRMTPGVDFFAVGQQGAFNGPTQFFNGYIDEFRFVIGQAVYTTNFTPPAMPYDPIMDFPDETVILLHFDGANGSTFFEDSSFYGRVFSDGKPYISTDQSVFGGASGLFSGTTGSYVSTPDSMDFTLGVQDFCVDFWVRHVSLTGRQNYCGQVNAANQATAASIYGYKPITTNRVQFDSYSGATAITVTSTTALVANQWYHVAYTRQGSVFRLFINGIQEATTTSALAINDSANAFSVGTIGELATNPMNGYIDEFRFVIGSPVYTTNFTPPIAPYPNP